MANELSKLGEVLMQGSRDYMNISLANQADERNRARQLEDRASAEAGEEQRFQRGVMTQREERRLAKDEAFQAGVIQALVNEGYLKPSDAGNPDAVAAAYTRASEAGLIKRYETLVTQGLLKPSEVGDQAKVNAALEKMGATNLQTSQDAKAEATRTRDEAMQVQSQMQALNQQLDEPAQMPTNSQIESRAFDLAKEANPGKSDADVRPKIQGHMLQAAKDLTERAQNDKYQRGLQIRQEQQVLEGRLQYLEDRQQSIETRFRVAPSMAPALSPSAMTAPAPQASRQPTAQERAAALVAEMGARKPSPESAPPPSGAASTYGNPFQDPEIQAFNDRQEAAALVNRVRPLQDNRQKAAAKIQDAEARISALRANPAMVPGQGSFGGVPLNPLEVQPGYQRTDIPDIIRQGQRPNDNRVKELSRLYAQLEQGKADQTEAEKALAEYEAQAKRGARPAMVKTSPFTNPVFAPPAQTPGFRSGLSLAPAM